MQSWRLQLLAYLGGTWQFRWHGLAAAWVVCVTGWLGVASIPNTFQSVAKVYIDTHTLLGPLLKGLAVTTDPEQEIQVMLQTLAHRSQCGERRAGDQSERRIDVRPARCRMPSPHCRNNVSLQNLQSKDLYSIAYTDRDPAYAQSVAQTLVSVLIDSISAASGATPTRWEASSTTRSPITSKSLKMPTSAGPISKRPISTSSPPRRMATQMSGTGDVVAAKTAVMQAQTALDEAVERRDNLRAQLSATPATLDVNAPLPAVMDRERRRHRPADPTGGGVARNSVSCARNTPTTIPMWWRKSG